MVEFGGYDLRYVSHVILTIFNKIYELNKL